VRTATDVDGGSVNIDRCIRIYPVQRVNRWYMRAVLADGEQIDLAGAFDCKDDATATIQKLHR